MAYKKDYKKGAKRDKMERMDYFSHDQGDMMAHVDDYSKPAGCYSQEYDQAPLRYIERNTDLQEHEASKLRSEDYVGRYDK